LTLRKEYLGGLDDGLSSFYAEILVIFVIYPLDSVGYRWQMIVLCPPIKVGKYTSLTVGSFTGCSGLHSVGSIQFLIGIVVVSEELGILSLAYPDMDHIEPVTIIANGDNSFVTALLSPGRIGIEPDPLHFIGLR
jgi:hypothetical protein